MFFFLIHNIVHYVVNWAPETTEGRKNVFTVFGGSILHVIFYVVLEWLSRTQNSIFLSILRNFYLYILGADLLTMVAVYKLYWGRGIGAEISDPDEWSFDSKNHKYKRKIKTLVNAHDIDNGAGCDNDRNYDNDYAYPNDYEDNKNLNPYQLKELFEPKTDKATETEISKTEISKTEISKTEISKTEISKTDNTVATDLVNPSLKQNL